MSSSSPKWVEKFDSTREDHCIWLKSIGNAMEKVTSGERFDIIRQFEKNPMKLKLESAPEMAYVHFQLCMKYAQAVLDGHAWTPPQKN
jgi:hypothetical protein